MKYRLIILFCCFALKITAQTRINLNAGWVFNERGKTLQRNAIVPGCVQADLLRLKQIPDPFIGLNESKIEWIENTGWEYHRRIDIMPALLKNESIMLVFEGLDTYAQVYLNNKLILSADNMFRTYKIDAKQYLKSGSNVLTVKFASVVETAKPLALASHIKYPADNEKGSIKISPFVRKPGFQFGWDFAPRLLTTGIWKPVYLEYFNKAAINDVQVIVKQFNPKRASCIAVTSVAIKKAGNYRLTLTDKDTGKKLWETTKTLNVNTTGFEQEFTLPHPKIWWPNGMGNQGMHRLAVKLTSPGGFSTEKVVSFGVRDIQLINEKDSIGESFYVKVNGKPVFIKGANFVPVSSLIQTENSARLDRLFKDMVAGNFNMIRVWGGGYYESDEFYRLADRNGILVWQDFPFACTMYPSDEAFLASVKQEAIDNIKRIRNHPSLALWCGNNEIAVGWKNWGWQKSYGYTEADSIGLITGYNKLFKKLLPELVQTYDAKRFYFDSSPISNWGKPEDFKKGDNHYWGVYHGEAPFSAYETHIPRFNSEFGFQSFPSWKTLQQITGSEDPKLESDVLTQRQKSYKGNKLLSKYMDWYYQPPASDKKFVYLSQLQQAEGMKTAIEASRSAMPYNMGTLVWQLNDVWPAISWSAIEYNGRWKAAQYFIKKAYAPHLLTVRADHDSLSIKIIQDSPSAFDAHLLIKKWNMQGLVKTDTVKVNIEGSVSEVKFALKDLQIKDRSAEFVEVELINKKWLICSNIYYFVPVKTLKLPVPLISKRVIKENDRLFVVLRSEQLAKNVMLEFNDSATCHFYDNYFDLLPGKEVKILVQTAVAAELLMKNLTVTSVASP